MTAGSSTPCSSTATPTDLKDFLVNAGIFIEKMRTALSSVGFSRAISVIQSKRFLSTGLVNTWGTTTVNAGSG